MTSPEPSFEYLLTLVEHGDRQQLSLALQQPSAALKTESVLVDAQTGVRVEKLNLRRLLEASASLGNEDIVETLLQFGQQHNVPVSEMITPDTLGAALQEKPLEVLLKYQAVDPKAFSRPLHLGSDLFDIACSGGPNEEDIPRGKYLGLLQYLLETGSDPNKQIRRKRPGYLLHKACWFASCDIVECLLKHGAVIEGSRAMRTASSEGRIDVLEVLLKYGGDVNEAYDKEDTMGPPGTALDVAVAKGHEDVVRWLSDHGAKRI
jgi:ankyrin repeat protein